MSSSLSSFQPKYVEIYKGFLNFIEELFFRWEFKLFLAKIKSKSGTTEFRTLLQKSSPAICDSICTNRKVCHQDIKNMTYVNLCQKHLLIKSFMFLEKIYKYYWSVCRVSHVCNVIKGTNSWELSIYSICSTHVQLKKDNACTLIVQHMCKVCTILNPNSTVL